MGSSRDQLVDDLYPITSPSCSDFGGIGIKENFRDLATQQLEWQSKNTP
jgi:hypothetical protein